MYRFPFFLFFVPEENNFPFFKISIFISRFYVLVLPCTTSSYGASLSFIPYYDVIQHSKMREESWFALQKNKDPLKQKEALKKLHSLFDDSAYARLHKPIYTKAQRTQIIYDALEDIDVLQYMTAISTYMKDTKNDG